MSYQSNCVEMPTLQQGNMTFNSVEKTELMTMKGELSNTNKRIDDIDEKIGKIVETLTAQGKTLGDITYEYPLMPAECDDISKAVKKKGVEVLGGIKSAAYNNRELRKKVFMDIYREVKRQYGLITETGKQMPYKKLQRKYFKPALATIASYEVPTVLNNEIVIMNEVDSIDF